MLVRWNETPLAVLELKRKGSALTEADVEQGLSYASVIRPRFPLVVVTNGDETRILELAGRTCREERSPRRSSVRHRRGQGCGAGRKERRKHPHGIEPERLDASGARRI
ncbi:hypothetical protein [Bradyrhizobium sp. USDA 4011]